MQFDIQNLLSIPKQFRSSCRLAVSQDFTWCLTIAALWIAGCSPATSKPAKPPAPSAITKEDQLTTVELTSEAETRLDLTMGTVETRSLPRSRTIFGVVMLPTGSTVVVSAPVAGLLQIPSRGEIVKVGAKVTEKQPILTLLPLSLSPSERTALAVARAGVSTQRADAVGQVKQAQTQVEASRIAYDRAMQQLESGSGTRKVVDDTKANLTLAEKALETALSRKKIMDEITLDEEADGDRSPLIIDAPQSGLLRTIYVMPGEVVTVGAPLFEVMNTDTLWVRVPVYVGESSEIDGDKPAEISEFSDRPEQKRIKAQPIGAPPTADANSSTLDLYYEFLNADVSFRPGQRVSVELATNGAVEQRTVPNSAVVHDYHGGSWVYEKIGERKYVRRRIQMGRVVGTWAVIEQGPSVGTNVVITGVAEIFGTEFGFDSK